MSPLAAVEILRAAVERCGREKVNTPEVRGALRKLKPHCPNRAPLDMLWDAAGGENDIGRSQGVSAAFRGICRQLGLPDWAGER